MSERPVAIVTGASSGIGAETALAFARRGYAVVLAARRADRLAAVAEQCHSAGVLTSVKHDARAAEEHAGATPSTLAGEKGADPFMCIPTDVAVEQQVKDLIARTMERFGRIDVLVNNAGFGHFARVHETTTEDMRRIFETNFYGVFWGCRAAAPIMIAQKRGHIFNVSSIIGKRGSPYHGAYSATKFALMGLTDCLRVELRPYGVCATSVCPALTDTEFFQHSRRGQRAGQSFRRFKSLTPPRVVAEKIARAVGKHKPEILITAGGRLLVLINALWPALADRMMGLYHNDLARKLAEDEEDAGTGGRPLDSQGSLGTPAAGGDAEKRQDV